MPATRQAAARNILDFGLNELSAEMVRLGLPSYRAVQVFQWVFRKGVRDFAAMTNIPKLERALLAERFSICLPRVVATAVSIRGDTRKFLLELSDGARIECVLMRDDARHTLCLSSQVGCPLGCAFCATGQMGFTRDLSAGEIIGQVLVARSASPLSNLVFMGMGEPLLNLDNVLKAITVLCSKDGAGLSPRRITVSTSGILSGICRLRESGVGVNLALSLNSPFEEERKRLMPSARRASLNDLLAACQRYASETGRTVSLEYVMLAGVNTSARHAAELAHLAKQVPAKVNLIAFNPVAETGFKPPERAEIHRFRDMLVAHGIRVTIRFRRGRDIAAGCGQLRGEFAASEAQRHGEPRSGGIS